MSSIFVRRCIQVPRIMGMAYPGESSGVALWVKIAGVSFVIVVTLALAAVYFRPAEPPKQQSAPTIAPADARAIASDPNHVPGKPPAVPSQPLSLPNEARIVPNDNRAVSSEQQATLSREVSVKGMKLAILKYSDKESAAYANQLIDAFRKSGAQVQTLLVGISDDPAAGIVLDRNGGETDRIAAYLSKAGILFTIGQAASVPSSARVAFSGVPIVVVGLKP